MAASEGRAIGTLFRLSFTDKLSEKNRLISDGGMGGRGSSWHRERVLFYVGKSAYSGVWFTLEK